MNFPAIPEQKKVVIFELDDVLYPQKDYDLQVYYLFANFIAYLETFPPAQEVISFIQKRYEIHQNDGMFKEVAATFGMDTKYEENLKLLFKNAKLPLKLLLFKEALELLQELTVNRVKVFILTGGNPQQQLNKITQTKWHGLDQYLKVYFKEELGENALGTIIKENELNDEEVLFIGKSEEDRGMALRCGIDFNSLV
ncbi:MAG: HAD hydrolase-like protein [Sphingobacteriales bacterium]|nr:HAD hydrolase-like protein [Sphingobacteriales bacterium]